MKNYEAHLFPKANSMFAELGVILPKWVQVEVIARAQYWIEENENEDGYSVYEILPDYWAEKSLIYKEKSDNGILVAYKEAYQLRLLDSFSLSDPRIAFDHYDMETIVNYLQSNNLVSRCSNFICDEDWENNLEWEQIPSEVFVRSWYYVSEWLAKSLSMAGELILPLGDHFLWGYHDVGIPTEDKTILDSILERIVSE